MKETPSIFLLLFSQIAFCASFGEERDWEFIQSVGGITTGDPVFENGGWQLPVQCNVAGLRKITVKPTMLNSGLVWADTEARIKDGVIYLSVETTLAGIGDGSSDCGPAMLGDIKPGKYNVMYLSPNKSSNFIGEIEIGL